MKQLQVFLTGLMVVVAVTASLLIQRRAQSILRENEAVLRRQGIQLADLAAQNQRLSNLALQTKTNSATADLTAELAKLRAKAESLRQQANRLAKQLAETRRSMGVRFFSRGDFNLLDHNRQTAITAGGGPPVEGGKLNDAKSLTAALRTYADAHQGGFPLNLDQVAAYLPKPPEADTPEWANKPLTGTNDFEIMFQGSQNDLTNIPARRVALIRERQPWLTPDGKWARVYGYADGAAGIVESDDNFQSWEAQHIIPPQTAGQ
jgi:hypothetical protein